MPEALSLPVLLLMQEGPHAGLWQFAQSSPTHGGVVGQQES